MEKQTDTSAFAQKVQGRWQISSLGYALVERMSAAGCSQGTVAKGLGMPFRTFQDRLDQNNSAFDEDLHNAWETGGSELETELVQSLADKARNGDGPSAMFLLKSKRKFIDRHIAPAIQPDRPTVNIVLPAPATAEELAKLTQQMTQPMVDVTPDDDPKPTTSKRKEVTR